MYFEYMTYDLLIIQWLVNTKPHLWAIQFYICHVSFQKAQTILTTNIDPAEILIGNSKDSLDWIGDHNFTTSEVVTAFGCFIKYCVRCCSIP